MNKIAIIYNQTAGRSTQVDGVLKFLDYLLQEACPDVHIYPTCTPDAAEWLAIKACELEVDIIVAVGGDGTLNQVINGMMKSSFHPLLAIYPTGSVNDFASALDIPKQPEIFADMLIKGKKRKVDLGEVNGSYFVNVAAAGAFTYLAHEVSKDAKKQWGRFAYYVKGFLKIPSELEKSYRMNFVIDGVKESYDTNFFLLSNSFSIGGYNYANPYADIQDGLMDLIIVEKLNAIEIVDVLTKLIAEDHVNHPKVHYKQLKSVDISLDEPLILDLDGEESYPFPVTINVVHRAIEIIVP